MKIELQSVEKDAGEWIRAVMGYKALRSRDKLYRAVGRNPVTILAKC